MKRVTLIGISSFAAVLVFGAATTAAIRVTNRRRPPKRRARLDAKKADASNASHRLAAVNGLRSGARALPKAA